MHNIGLCLLPLPLLLCVISPGSRTHTAAALCALGHWVCGVSFRVRLTHARKVFVRNCALWWCAVLMPHTYGLGVCGVAGPVSSYGRRHCCCRRQSTVDNLLQQQVVCDYCACVTFQHSMAATSSALWHPLLQVHHWRAATWHGLRGLNACSGFCHTLCGRLCAALRVIVMQLVSSGCGRRCCRVCDCHAADVIRLQQAIHQHVCDRHARVLHVCITAEQTSTLQALPHQD